MQLLFAHSADDFAPASHGTLGVKTLMVALHVDKGNMPTVLPSGKIALAQTADGIPKAYLGAKELMERYLVGADVPASMRETYRSASDLRVPGVEERRGSRQAALHVVGGDRGARPRRGVTYRTSNSL